MTDEDCYLKLLNIGKDRPSLTFLAEIVRQHLACVPYENISKLIRFNEVGPTIPSFPEYVAAAVETNFGGTCFAQNIHLNHLLNDLGFNSKLVGVRREGSLSHVSLRVQIDEINYLVDVGIMSSVAGPYRINPDSAFDFRAGNQRYIFKPSKDLENYCLEIHRDGKIIRSFQSTSEPVAPTELEAGVRKTFEPSAMFMTTLCVHRTFENHSVGIWNNHLYKTQGKERIVRDIQTFLELEEAFRDELLLPDYPLRKSLELLQGNGAPHLF